MIGIAEYISLEWQHRLPPGLQIKMVGSTAAIHFFKLVLVVKVARIVKIHCRHGTFLKTCAAFYTDTGHFHGMTDGDCFTGDRTHRTH